MDEYHSISLLVAVDNGTSCFTFSREYMLLQAPALGLGSVWLRPFAGLLQALSSRLVDGWALVGQLLSLGLFFLLHRGLGSEGNKEG